jgi:hypothetical protein
VGCRGGVWAKVGRAMVKSKLVEKRVFSMVRFQHNAIDFSAEN